MRQPLGDGKAVAVGLEGASKVALRHLHVANLLVGHRQIALPVGVAGIGLRQPLSDGEAVAVGLERAARSPCATCTSPIRRTTPTDRVAGGVAGIGLRQPLGDGEIVAVGLERAGKVALLHLHVANFWYDTDRSRCQPALPGSDCASRSSDGKAVAVGLERAGQVALLHLHVANLSYDNDRSRWKCVLPGLPASRSAKICRACSAAASAPAVSPIASSDLAVSSSAAASLRLSSGVTCPDWISCFCSASARSRMSLTSMAFADRLETALKARDFEPRIDRTEIYAFEDWWKRIEALIGKADTVVFVLSPDAVASEIALKDDPAHFEEAPIVLPMHSGPTCMDAGLVKGEGFAVDASVLEANASRYHGKAPDEIAWAEPGRQSRAVKEYLAGLDVDGNPMPIASRRS